MFKDDWETIDDYDPEDANWIDLTTLGSDYEVQIDVDRENHYRHRERSFGSPWKEGNAPDAFR